MPRNRRAPLAATQKPAPKSGKQRRMEIRVKRREKIEHRPAPRHDPRKLNPLAESAPCNVSALAPYNSYGDPEFVTRGFYVDEPFICVGCGKEEVWTATRQKWWYEIAKGHPYTKASRCRACRRRERERAAKAREVHLEGLARKKLKA